MALTYQSWFVFQNNHFLSLDLLLFYFIFSSFFYTCDWILMIYFYFFFPESYEFSFFFLTKPEILIFGAGPLKKPITLACRKIKDWQLVLSTDIAMPYIPILPTLFFNVVHGYVALHYLYCRLHSPALVSSLWGSAQWKVWRVFLKNQYLCDPNCDN